MQQSFLRPAQLAMRSATSALRSSRCRPMHLRSRSVVRAKQEQETIAEGSPVPEERPRQKSSWEVGPQHALIASQTLGGCSETVQLVHLLTFVGLHLQMIEEPVRGVFLFQTFHRTVDDVSQKTSIYEQCQAWCKAKVSSGFGAAAAVAITADPLT